MSLTFLSDQWFEALREQLSTSPPLPGDSAVSIRIGQLVAGVPAGGDRAWTLTLQGGRRPVLEVGSAVEAEVVLVESYDSAWALASGECTAGHLLEAGKLKIRGDARRLVAAAELLEAVAVASSALRELTTRD